MTNEHHLIISYDPGALRAHYDGLKVDPTAEFTDEELEDAAGDFIACTDWLWEQFHDHCETILQRARKKRAADAAVSE